MKKVKTFLCSLMLSTLLVGNVFAGEFSTAGITGLFQIIINNFLEISKSSDTCPLRICTNCRPGTTDDGNGNCKPTQN